MSTVISVENLAKKYTLSHQQKGDNGSLREVITNGISSFGNRFLKPFRRSLAPCPLPHDPAVEDFWALKDVSFEVKQGDRIGIIGRNGAGKSTLLKILSRITEPTTGSVRIKGRVASLLEVGTGFHPELTGRENIYLNGAILGMGKEEIRRKFDEIVAFAEIEKFLDTPVKRYSSGMYVRLAFAVAAHLEPEILIVDEVLAVGDAQFQKKCLGKMEEVGSQGRTVLFVSHNMSAVKSLCSRSVLLQNGRLVFDGVTVVAVNQYLQRDGQHQAMIRWQDGNSPVIPSAFLVEAGVLNDGQAVGADLTTELSIQIYIKFRVIRPALVGTTVVLHNAEGQVIFVSISNHEPEWHGRVRPPGLYESICEIPPNFLTDGCYTISIPFWEGFYEAGIVVDEAVRFTAHEKGLVRGDLPYEISRGITRPLLSWRSYRVEEL